MHCIVLYCIVLYCIVLYCIVLYCIVLYYQAIQNDVIGSSVLRRHGYVLRPRRCRRLQQRQRELHVQLQLRRLLRAEFRGGGCRRHQSLRRSLPALHGARRKRALAARARAPRARPHVHLLLPRRALRRRLAAPGPPAGQRLGSARLQDGPPGGRPEPLRADVSTVQPRYELPAPFLALVARRCRSRRGAGEGKAEARGQDLSASGARQERHADRCPVPRAGQRALLLDVRTDVRRAVLGRAVLHVHVEGRKLRRRVPPPDMAGHGPCGRQRVARRLHHGVGRVYLASAPR